MSPNVIATSIRIYGLLLYFYPKSFRQRFGDAMVGVFVESCHHAERRAGHRGLAGLWWCVSWDLIASAAAERTCSLLARQNEAVFYDRVKAVWLPAVLATVLSMTAFEFSNGFSPILMLHGVAIPLNWQWILCLPVVGGLGAYGSQRAGGRAWQRALAGISPALALGCMLSFFLLILLASHSFAHPLVVKFEICMLGWGVVPVSASLLGTLPFLRKRSPA